MLQFCFPKLCYTETINGESEIYFYEKRESFNSRWGFILACIGSGLNGKYLMFPHQSFLSMAWTFLIPYFYFCGTDRLYWGDR